jgi:hypothetical protein
VGERACCLGGFFLLRQRFPALKVPSPKLGLRKKGEKKRWAKKGVRTEWH